MSKLMMAVVCSAAALTAVWAGESATADDGAQVVQKMQETSQKDVPEAKTAREKVEASLDKTLGKWKVRRSSRKITVVDLEYPMENPVTEEKMFQIREMLAKRGLMQAKVQLAESMSVDVEAEDTFVVTPGEKLTTTFTSAVKMLAKNPQTVLGTTVLNQSESYENGVYHLAMAVCWSENLQKGAIAFLDPQKLVKGDADKQADAIEDWLGKQDLSTMCGPRQVMGPDGERIYVGIAAREVGSNAEVSRNNIRLAQMYAVQSLLFSLYSDVTFCDAAKNVVKQITAGDVNGITQGEAIETLERDIGIRAKKVLRGLDEIYGKTLVHPISQRKMYVSVYAISASKAAAAKALSADVAAFRARIARADAEERAFDRGLKDAVDNAANKANTDKARSDAQRAVEARTNSESLLPKANAGDGATGAGARPAAPAAKPKEGVFGGNETIDASIL